jgi:hypothetical protein
VLLILPNAGISPHRLSDGTYAMEASVKSYILRIYRFDPKSPNCLVGLAEEVGVEDKKAFTNLHELWDILRSPERRSAVDRGKRKESNQKRRNALETGMRRKNGKAGQKAPDSSFHAQEENKHES